MHRRQEIAEPRTTRMLAYGGATATAMTGAITLGSSLVIFIDPVSMLLVASGTIGPLLAIHGPWGVARALQSSFSYGTRDDLAHASQLWMQAGGFAMVTGTMTAIISVVQMLQGFDGSATYGHALAVSLLTPLYALGGLTASAAMALRLARRSGVSEAGGASVITLGAMFAAALVSLPLALMSFLTVAVQLGGVP